MKSSAIYSVIFSYILILFNFAHSIFRKLIFWNFHFEDINSIDIVNKLISENKDLLRQAFGLDSKDVLKIILSILKNQPVGAMDMVEISPTLDINDVTTWLGIKTLYEQLEKTRSFDIREIKRANQEKAWPQVGEGPVSSSIRLPAIEIPVTCISRGAFA